MSPVLLLLMVGHVAALCPPRCRCLWKSSKITVECTDMEARAIPADMDTGTQVLNLSQNSLQFLQAGVFAQAGLHNLQKINVGGNNISEIHPRAFAGLLNLVDIDLSRNALTSVPSQVSGECKCDMFISVDNKCLPIFIEDVWTKRFGSVCGGHQAL